MNPGDLGALGPYRVISELGRGGMGYVFRAEDTRLKRVIALKMMNRKIAATADSRRRFIEEARSMAAVKHDNVATIYEVNDQFATPFMAMELLRGGTLEDQSRQTKRFDYQTVIRYATQIANGLAAAHSQGIVHRDIKPANIWIEADSDRVKILDFGLALANVTVDQIAARGSVIGTPQYLSPEQASSEPLDDRTDLYSLGVVLFELCTGQLPFRVKNVAEQLIATLVHKPVRVNTINPEIPEPLAALIARLLQKEPRRRPASAIALANLLEKAATDCEAKSDVAQAINKLQAQLNLVATKQPAPLSSQAAPWDVASPAVMGDNVFDELPLPGPAIPTPKATAAISVGTPLRPVTSFGKPANASASKQGENSLLRFWPIAAIGAVAMVLMAVVAGVWYGTMSASSRGGNIMIMPMPEMSSGIPVVSSPAAPQVVPPTPTISVVAPQSSENAERRGSSDAVPPDATGGSPATQDATVKKNKSKAKNKSRSNEPASVVTAAGDTGADNMNGRDSETASSIPSSPAMEGAPESSAVIKTNVPVILEKISWSTSDGGGADTTVKRGGSKSEQLGQDLSIAVQTRGQVDIQHSYIRFDRKAGKFNSQNIAGVELVLSLPGAPAPAGSQLRVYGVPEEARDDWAESGLKSLNWSNSLSREPLTKIPLLAEITITGNDSATELRIRDERMTEFVGTIQEDFLTFVLAGGSLENKPMYFISREGDRERAPTLHIEVADAER